MILNILKRTLRSNNGTVLKCVSVPEQIIFSQKYYTTSSIDPNYYLEADFQNINPRTLHTFWKMRNFLTKCNKYETSSTRTLNIDLFMKKQFIENIKIIDWSSLSNKQRLKNFKLISIYAMQHNELITNKEYEEMFSILRSNCCKLNDNELHVLMKCLELWPKIHMLHDKNNYIRMLLEEIDIELAKRSTFWSTDKTLMFCDTMCRYFTFYTKFISKSLNRLISNPSTLTSKNFVQIMYYLFIYKLPKVKVRQLEPFIEKHFEQFSVEELGIICLGFFRSEVFITNDTFLCKIMQVIIDNSSSISDKNLGALLKVIRYSFMTKSHCINVAEKLFETMISKVPSMSFQSLTQLSHLKADALLYNEALLTAITKRFTKILRNARLKDIERMIFLLTTFNYPPSNPIYRLIINELRSPVRNEEKKYYPKILGFTLRHLAVANIYPLDLISYIMQEKYMNLAYGKSRRNLGVEYFFLDQSIKIEVPDYRGPKLTNEIRGWLAKKFDVEESYTIGNETKQKIIKIFNDEFKCKNAVYLHRILPHFSNKDIILCLDEGIAIKSESIVNNINSYIKQVLENFRKNKKWLVIIVATETLLIKRTNQFSGLLSAKIRQLKKVGYEPIVIPQTEWKNLHNDTLKFEYLKTKIFESNN